MRKKQMHICIIPNQVSSFKFFTQEGTQTLGTSLIFTHIVGIQQTPQATAFNRHPRLQHSTDTPGYSIQQTPQATAYILQALLSLILLIIYTQ